jgi:predicted kinase
MSYIDATNLTRFFRRPFLQIAKEFGCQAEAIYFDVPLEVCLERNRKRENLPAGPARDARVVPDEVLRRMARQLEPPSKGEGFARITTVRTDAKKSRSRAKGS